METDFSKQKWNNIFELNDESKLDYLFHTLNPKMAYFSYREKKNAPTQQRQHEREKRTMDVIIVCCFAKFIRVLFFTKDILTPRARLQNHFRGPLLVV